MCPMTNFSLSEKPTHESVEQCRPTAAEHERQNHVAKRAESRLNRPHRKKHCWAANGRGGTVTGERKEIIFVSFDVEKVQLTKSLNRRRSKLIKSFCFRSKSAANSARPYRDEPFCAPQSRPFRLLAIEA